MGKNLCLILLFALTLLPLASAANLGISPAKLTFPDTMRGGYAQDYISVVIDSENPMFVEAETVGDIADWINLSQTIFNVSRESPGGMQVTLNVPTDAPNGNYTGYIRVKISSNERADEGHMMGKVHSNLDLKVTIGVTDKEVVDCKVTNLKALSAEQGDDIILRMDIENNGNTRISPLITAETWDTTQSTVVQTDDFTSKEILPTTKESLEFKIKSKDLAIAQYWTDILIPKCEQSKLLTFDILEEGSLNSKGVILSMVANLNGKVGEISQVEVGFKNIGEKEVDAKFSGKVSRNGKIVSILESEEISVTQSEIEKFNLFFTPEDTGEYIVSGRVLYEGKRTYEKSITITVATGSFDQTYLVYGAFIVFISFILFKIQKEKNKFKTKIRGIR